MSTKPTIVDKPDHDLDLREWLAQEERVVDRVRVTAGTLKVAALTEDTFEKYQKSAYVADKTKGRGATKFDSVLFKQLIVCHSLAEANGVSQAEVMAQIKGKLAGDLVVIFERVSEISGFDKKDSESADLETFFG